MRTQAWLSSRQSTTHDTEFGEERHRETSARNGYRLSSFADGSDGADCPNIGTDGECCRCIGQALKILIVRLIAINFFNRAAALQNVIFSPFYALNFSFISGKNFTCSVSAVAILADTRYCQLSHNQHRLQIMPMYRYSCTLTSSLIDDLSSMQPFKVIQSVIVV